MATQALGQALKTNMSKPPKMTAGETYMQSVEPTLKELKGAEEQKMKAEKEKAIFTGESESRRQQALAQATETETTAMREDPARAKYESLIQEKAKAEFIPTQENAQDMAALFSLMNVIGFAIGSGGKTHAQQAMSAMNGMLEGHQKGRDDLYRQQRNIFEINQKQLDKKIDDLYKFMQENTKLYAKDKLAAEQNANAKFAEEGASFLKAYYEKYGPGPALEYMKQVVKAKEHAADLTDKERTRAEQQAFRLQQAREAIQARKDLFAMKMGGVSGKTLSDKQSKEIEGLDSLSNGLEQLKKDFKPEFASLGVLGFGADMEFEARRRLGDKKGQEAISWWSRYERLQAPNRHALFGATLTGNELRNYQLFTAKKSDSPETVKTYLEDQINYSKSIGQNKKLVYEAAGYKVPEAKARDFIQSFSGGETQNFQQEAIKRFGSYDPNKYDYGFEDGKFYRDAK